jgi:ATP-dependent DNA helicase RecG
MVTVFDFSNLVETDELEFKAAQGQNGKGEVPKDFWETYSAFANTNGGTVLLGIQENKDYSFNVLGIKDIQKVQKTLWDLFNDKNKISVNLLSNKDVRVESVEGKNVLVITVPRATRHQRPVYIGTNPLSGTYRRNGEGDYKCDGEAVKRMIAEAQIDARDHEILEGFWLQDLEESSIIAYRNIFTSLRPTDEMSQLDNEQFLYRLQAWNQDRSTNKKGLTLAGLLMFGKIRAIYDKLPHYKIDFFEYGENENDWIDRVSNDGTWSGNLFDFYRRTYPKLTQEVKVPFALDENQRRIDDTDVHKALREAFTNTVIHADHYGTSGISIKKFRDRFLFRNPGMSRFPIDRALYRGGRSDCRNPILQAMFRFIGSGEQAGSGFPRIVSAWRNQQWRSPLFSDSTNPEISELVLPVVSLLPPEVLQSLQQQFGNQYATLTPNGVMTLALAHSEERISNVRLQEVLSEHPRDITTLLQTLVTQGFLEQEGKQGRGTYYHLPSNSPLLNENSPLLNENSPLLNENSSLLRHDLVSIAATARNSGKVSKKEMQQIITTLCEHNWLTLSEIAEFVGREAKYLQDKYLTPMVREQVIQMQFPITPNHPQQRYKAMTQTIEDSNNLTLFS